MLSQILALAMIAPGRQHALRRAVVLHVLLLLGGLLAVDLWGQRGLIGLGQMLLITGIVEGAILVGWRLTQLPKSLALEFLLVTPQLPRGVFLAEAFAGLGRLALVTLSGLPLLTWLVIQGQLLPWDLVALAVMPFTWGAITGIGLTTWAYEPLLLRKIGEKLILLAILFYLGVGVLIGEHLLTWLSWFPQGMAGPFSYVFHAFHHWNPFAVMQSWMDVDYAPPLRIAPATVEERMLGLEIAALATLGLMLVRSAFRLKGHFHERHYRPILDPTDAHRGTIGERPLTWWAVKRVTEYAGRANVWLAAGFGCLFALYTVAESSWPPWLGRAALVIFRDSLGGIPVMSTALVVLAAVPAAWQYGLWDSNVQDRCRRLELLLLTELEGRDYWHAAATAAWNRGRGYFYVAVVLWLAALIAGQMTLWQTAAAVVAGVLLWTLYFALGFRAFARGVQANGLGSLLALGLPGLTYILVIAGWPFLVSLVPPGSVYSAAQHPPSLAWCIGPLAFGTATLILARIGLDRCDTELRRWYDLNHGHKVVE